MRICTYHVIGESVGVVEGEYEGGGATVSNGSEPFETHQRKKPKSNYSANYCTYKHMYSTSITHT